LQSQAFFAQPQEQFSQLQAPPQWDVTGSVFELDMVILLF
jgi:hypothetical protein